MNNAEILDQITLYAQLLELHGENHFKIRSYHNAVQHLEKQDIDLTKLTLNELEKLPNVGKAIALKIDEARTVGQFHQLTNVLAKTPAGIVAMLGISGLGIKKVQQLWEAQIESLEQLMQACEDNKIAEMKGFGEKTQENIRQALLFKLKQEGKYNLPEATLCAEELTKYWQNALPTTALQLVGELRQGYETIQNLTFLAPLPTKKQAIEALANAPFLTPDISQASLFAWAGKFNTIGMQVEVRFIEKTRWGSEAFMLSAAPKHLGASYKNKTLLQIAVQENFPTEEALYAHLGWATVPAEMREGGFEIDLARQNALPTLLEIKDIKGILHAHSTYSDGKHTLEQMAQACIEKGFTYLGITDHSKTAAYAGGLSEGRVLQQMAEIDQLNAKLAPFRIFKGIESDILPDGSLDYADDILKKFDFVIASIHAGFKMSAEKATERIIKAVENPYTTILGHPTGRLLLRREGYPVKMDKVIDACAQNKVVIEINANSWRLDLDWRWVRYTLDKGVLLSINPDSHSKDSLMDIQWGVTVGRKGGLTASQTLNALSIGEIASYFEGKHKK
jgi:DNA polymerase (family 10)